MDRDETTRELAKLAGIWPGYRNAVGRILETPIESIRHVLRATGFPADKLGEMHDSLAQLRARRDRLVAYLIVCEYDQSFDVKLRRGNTGAEWALQDEAGGSIAEGTLPRTAAPRIELPALDVGYYQLTTRADDVELKSTVIAAPRRCWQSNETKQRWGISGAVYGIRTEQDLGIGDFGSITGLADAAARRGASFLGLSPLHALFPMDRERISPYSPSSRLFVDPIYIDVSQLPGFEGAASLSAPEKRGLVGGGRFVDYPAVWAIKRPLLEAIWRKFQQDGDASSFDAFCAERGAPLELHALFDTLTELDPENRPGGGTTLPGNTDGRWRLLSPHRERISFHMWQQWVADVQLERAAAEARAAGMEIGLISDLAAGASPDGSELWSSSDQFLTNVTIGAPPDLLAPHGQEWGLRAFDPFALERNAMKGFRDLVAAGMRHCGGVRIDHAFQLQRLFLVPPGLPASEGVYLRYPTEAMLAILRIESRRARCIVIGEDLGTKPPDFAETLQFSGVLGYRVVYFERGADNDFLAPEVYDPDTMAVINTHDLATLEGWWCGQDIADRLKYGVIDADRAERSAAERHLDRKRIVALLRREGLIGVSDVPEEAPAEALTRLLARCRSKLVGFSLDDIVGEVHQQNVPGVTEGPPNWRRRLPLTVSRLAAAGGPLDRFARVMAADGRGNAASSTS